MKLYPDVTLSTNLVFFTHSIYVDNFNVDLQAVRILFSFVQSHLRIGLSMKLVVKILLLGVAQR